MSKRKETSLSLLLKLNAGLLDESQARNVRQQIACDDRWERRWLKLRELGFESELLDWSPAADDEMDTQHIAEFLDATLPWDEARELERRAWKNPQLLREIAATFQLVHLPLPWPNQTGEDKSSLADRVTEMVRGPVNGHARPLVSQSELNREQLDTGVTRRQLVAWALSLAAVLVLLATVVVLGIFANSRNRPPQAKEPPHHQTTPLNATESLDHWMPDEESPIPQVHPVPRTPEESLADNDDPQPSREIPSPNLNDKSDYRKNSRTANNQPAYRPMQPEWEQFKGIIAVRESDSDNIRGFGNVLQLSEETEILVLPGSWAKGALADFGSLVVDSDTVLKVGKRTGDDSVGSDLEISLTHGRLAVLDLAKGTSLLIHTGDVRWPVSVSREDTTLGVEFGAGTARLFVRRGQASIRGKPLVNNQHIVWQRGSFSEPTRANLATRWIDRPEGHARIPDRLRDQLFQSRDLNQSLAQMINSRDPATRMAALHWQWTLQPVRVSRILRSNKFSDQWAQAMSWLVDQPVNYPRTRAIWRSLRESVGNEDAIRDFVRWHNLIANHEMPQPNQVETMTNYLVSDQLLVRFLAAHVLDKSFGNRGGYLPQAPANARIRAARVWRHHIGEVYQRMLRQRRDR